MLPTAIYDRPSLALMQALRGRPENIVQSIIDPEALPPEHLETTRDLLPEANNSIIETLMSVVSNPVVLGGMLLSMAFPVANSANALRIREAAVNYTKRLGPILSKLVPARDRFPKPVADLMDDIIVGVANSKERFSQKLAGAVHQYNTTLGRNADAAIGIDSQRRISSLIEGMDRPSGALSKILGIKGPVLNKAKIDRFYALNPKLRAAETAAANQVRDLLDVARMESVGSTAPSIIGAFLESAKANRPWAALPAAKRFAKFSGSATEASAALRKYGIKASGTLDDIAKAVLDQHGGRLPNMMLLSESRLAHLTKLAEKRGIKLDLDTIDDYYPHMRIFNAGAVENLFAMDGKSTLDPRMVSMMSSRAAGSKIGSSARERLGRMIPDLDELNAAWGGEAVTPIAAKATESMTSQHIATINSQLKKAMASKNPVQSLARVVDDFAAQAGMSIDELEDLRGAVTLAGEAGGSEAAFGVAKEMLNQYAPGSPFRKYSLDLLPVLEQHNKGLASMEWWTFRGLGDKILHETNKLDSVRKKEMLTTRIPELMGKRSFEQSIQSAEATYRKNQMLQKIDSKSGVFKLMPDKMRGWMRNRVEEMAGDPRGVAGHMASYFYTTTLGFNVPSAIKNLLQTTLTTMPVAGAGNTFKGIKATNQQVGKYFAQRSAGKSANEAFHLAFPDFIAAGMDPNPLTEQLLKGAMESSFRSATKVGGTARKVQDAAMAMFQASERYNRLVAFNTGRIWYQKIAPAAKGIPIWNPASGVLSDEGRFARQLVQMTQFPAGPGETPRLIEGVSPIWRQFLHFPLRYVGFLGSSTLRGPAGPAWAGGLNLGTLGRSAAASATIFEAGRSLLGTDLSGGLLTGALPLPSFEGAPFYPAPVVPPALSIAGSVATAMDQGSLEPLADVGWLMTPGGIQARRVYKAIRYADYQNRTEDGRIPVFSRTGSLIGNMTPQQIAMRAIGLRPASVAQESELMGYLSKQRDRISSIRRDYIEALAGGNAEDMQSIQNEWSRRFPGLGELSVRPQDVRAVQLRKETSRIEKMLESLPADVREEYTRMVMEVLGQEAQSMIGVDPSLLEPPRSTYRARRMSVPSMMPAPRSMPQAYVPQQPTLNPANTPGYQGYSSYGY
jgi:hypothetical protein